MTKEEIKFIMNVLRQGTIKWPGRSACLKRHRKKKFERIGKNGKRIYKYHWQCAQCKTWYRNEKSLEVDHVIEVGGFRGDWNEIINRMYDMSPSATQALCQVCHMQKTISFNNARFKYQRK